MRYLAITIPKKTGCLGSEAENFVLEGLERNIDILVDTEGNNFDDIKVFGWVLNPAWFQRENSVFEYENRIIEEEIKKQMLNPDSDLAKALFAQIEGEKEQSELEEREENGTGKEYADYVRDNRTYPE